MSLEIKVPPVGESISEVTLSRWIKKDGDQVEMDEVIAELESDKATFELTAEKAGTLKTIAAEGSARWRFTSLVDFPSPPLIYGTGKPFSAIAMAGARSSGSFLRANFFCK